MNLRWPGFKRLPTFLTADRPLPGEHRARIQYMERNIVLPVKAVIVVLLFHYLFFSNWLTETAFAPGQEMDVMPRDMALDVIRRFFVFYVAINAAAVSLLLAMDQLSHAWLERLIFTLGWIDGLFLAALTIVTGGFDSILYWVFLGLIIRNAVSTPDATRQISLNLIVSASYCLAGIIDVLLAQWEGEMLDDQIRAALESGAQDPATEPFVLRLSLLLLMTVCCYGVQVLFDKQRKATLEAQELSLRQQQLQAAGRLAAEIAHQLKNPLGIINNAAFTLQRTVKEGKTITQQIQIIREEVERSDRIITELMGYAQLTEGRVEKLNVDEELDRAIAQVFPPAAHYEVTVHRAYAAALPALLIQRGHLYEAFANVLQNAREAMNGRGNIWVETAYGDHYSITVRIRDDGPGIPPDKLANIFEPYFTTKERGTGLGLAIVKHNVELYRGTVEVQSELGRGTHFTIRLPATSTMRLRK